jgi:hypothetical protein
VALDFKIDNTKLMPPPSRFRANPPSSRPRRDVVGGYVASSAAYGWTFDVTFGSGQVADPTWAATLESARNGVPNHTIAYTDNGGTTHTHNVIWPEEVMHYIRWGNLSEAFTIRFYERSS